MHRNAAVSACSLVISVVACIVLAGAPLRASEPPVDRTPTVGFATKHGKSAPLRDYKPVGPVEPRPDREIPNRGVPTKGSGHSRSATDPVAQQRFGLSQPGPRCSSKAAATTTTRPSSAAGSCRPTPTATSAPTTTSSTSTSSSTMYDKAGNTVLGPFPATCSGRASAASARPRTTATRSSCTTSSRTAGSSASSLFRTSRTALHPVHRGLGDGRSDRRATTSTSSTCRDTYLNDYPKFGIWPDGYYMTFNGFDVFGGGFQGGAVAFDRTAMLAGAAGDDDRVRHRRPGRRAAVGHGRHDSRRRWALRTTS